MTQPNENSFYVTLTSSKTQEFPENSPSHFQYRLPQTLWLPGKWKVGLASLFLPGVSNPIPHDVTSHTSSSLIVHHETKPTNPFLPTLAQQTAIVGIRNLYDYPDTVLELQETFKRSLNLPKEQSKDVNELCKTFSLWTL